MKTNSQPSSKGINKITLLSGIFLMSVSYLNVLYAQKDSPSFINPYALNHWNEISTKAVHEIESGAKSPAPMTESRIYAMVSVAMHNVINTIHPKYKTYHFTEEGFRNADAHAAIAVATYDILLHELPGKKMYLDAMLHADLSTIPLDVPKRDGVTLGHHVATSILNERAADHANEAAYPVDPGSRPGEYRFTVPFDGQPFNTPPYKGLLDLPGWGQVLPFGMKSGKQFRPKTKPYALNSKEYANEYNEIKMKGCDQCPVRSKDQTELAVFWEESSPLGWNRIARNVALNRHLDAPDLARLFALLHIAIADSYISSMDGKMYYNFWRPVTAIHMADDDNNPNTIPLAGWRELGFPTPPVPDYPSAHASAGGAAATVLKYVFETDRIEFETTSTTLSGVTRSFQSFSQAARENSLSRIYVGYHFRQATEVGEQAGSKIAKYIIHQAFK